MKRTKSAAYLSGETDDEKNQDQDQHPGQENLSGESEIDEKIPDEKQDLENKVLSGEFRWMRRKHRHDLEERAVSSTTLRQMIIQEAQEWTPIQTGIRTRDQNCQN